MTQRPKMNKKRMVWLDFETTGIDAPPKTQILEMAAIVTDNDLNELGHVSVLVPQPGFLLDKMHPTAREMHEASGLLQELQDLPEKDYLGPVQRAEEALARLITEHDAIMAPLCGSTIHFDRAYVNEYMPLVAWPKLLHYRNFDVSQTKQMVERWMPWLEVDIPEKRGTHRALDDIRESLGLARVYKNALSALRLQNESVLPMEIDDGTTYIVSSVSGGADEVDGMPRAIGLRKVSADGSFEIRHYRQNDDQVPTIDLRKHSRFVHEWHAEKDPGSTIGLQNAVRIVTDSHRQATMLHAALTSKGRDDDLLRASFLDVVSGLGLELPWRGKLVWMMPEELKQVVDALGGSMLAKTLGQHCIHFPKITAPPEQES